MALGKVAQIAILTVNASLLGFAAVVMPSGQPSSAKPKAKPKIEFNRDIRPILSNKCFTCHGQDPKQIRAGLKLNDRDSAYSLLKDGKHAIVPGDPDHSEVVARINAKNADDLMPPTGSNKNLTEEEKATLREWISEGAVYKEHWAFEPPVRPALPEVKLKSWPKNSIDRFILADMEDRGLEPSPEADKATLLRRVSLDIDGLPPTQAELKEFLADKSPDAYEKVVDRLLASPRYGERMAMDWMDYARYADSNGFQSDWERFQWRWRDWVIGAFNSNMPYDQFTIKQLAGDLLPHHTLDDVIATGFNRNHRINTEGGVIAEEWRVENVIDRVETTSEVWLGLTTGCARCHDHKYDPISQKDFYSLCAFFNNVPETGTGVEQPVNHPPFIRAPYPKQQADYDRLKADVAKIDGDMRTVEGAHDATAEAWTLAADPAASATKDAVAEYRLGTDMAVVAGAGPAPKAVGPLKHDEGRSTGAVTTTDKAYVELGNVADFQTDKPFSYSLWINSGMLSGSPVARMDSSKDYRGWDLSIADGRPACHVISKWPEDALKVISKTQIKPNEWTHVVVTYDGTAKSTGLKIYVDGKVTDADVERDSLKGSIHADVPATIGRRTASDMYSGKVDDLSFYSRVLTPNEVKELASVNPAKPLLLIPVDKRTKDQKATIDRLWCHVNVPEYSSLEADRYATNQKFELVDKAIPTVMVMEDMPKPRPCYVLIRGQYDHHGDVVTPRIPLTFGKLPDNFPNNRLGLAEWIVSPSNPMTSRVAVNRLWDRFFGTGIVDTAEDFGTRADYPTHPELLDWLGTEFVRLHWNLKAMMKEIAMSATYRQSSDITPALLAADPENKYLARGPRFRLSAEVIRDQAMYFAGMLTEKLGGPSVRPYQPDGVWDDVSVYGNLHDYHAADGPNLHRRSLYTIWKRTAPPPNMTLFDAPAREICHMMRARTDTPTQALVLMNDETYIEASRALAQKSIESAGNTPESRISFMFESTLCRTPSAAEMKILKGAFDRQLEHYQADKADAESLVEIGKWPRLHKVDTSLLAAYTMVGSTILNLDETITRD